MSSGTWSHFRATRQSLVFCVSRWARALAFHLVVRVRHAAHLVDLLVGTHDKGFLGWCHASAKLTGRRGHCGVRGNSAGVLLRALRAPNVCTREQTMLSSFLGSITLVIRCSPTTGGIVHCCLSAHSGSDARATTQDSEPSEGVSNLGRKPSGRSRFPVGERCLSQGWPARKARKLPGQRRLPFRISAVKCRPWSSIEAEPRLRVAIWLVHDRFGEQPV